MALNPLLTTKEVCELLKISPKSVQRLCQSRQIRHVRIGPRKLRFRPEDIERFISQREVMPRKTIPTMPIPK